MLHLVASKPTLPRQLPSNPAIKTPGSTALKKGALGAAFQPFAGVSHLALINCTQNRYNEMHILVVEDEVKLSDLLAQGLREEGHVADVALNARQALGKARSSEYDAVVLDVMLPDLDGFDTCRRLRQEGLLSPVLMLTARDDVRARVAGLDSGADDYMTKPFSFTELLARLRALARRGRLERSVVVEVGELRLDPAKRRVWRGGREISLSAQEFGLLEAFMRRPDRVLSRSQLLDYAWDIDADSNSNVVDVYVGYLRRKIDEPFGRSLLETVRGVGYRLREDDGC